ncbi:MAG: transposase, partial [Pseudomonadota bacterium]|nr:transposase [Pseudomonadota bacterium]
MPHHLTQRGNRRQQTFFNNEDYHAKDGLEAHIRYTRRINFRENWRGHLWQGRFSSFIMNEEYLLACTRYVELNPVR